MLAFPSPSSDWQAAAARVARATLAPRIPWLARPSFSRRPLSRLALSRPERVLDDDRGALLTPVIPLPVGLKGSRHWLDCARNSHRRSPLRGRCCRARARWKGAAVRVLAVLPTQ